MLDIHLVEDGEHTNVKKIFIMSDGTGQSAINVLRACVIQFDEPNVKLTIYSKVDEDCKIRNILQKADEEKAFVAFTIAKRSLRRVVHDICHAKSIPHHDILGPPVEKLKHFLAKEPKEDANLLRRVDSKYFKRIEAVDFAIEHDDGKNVRGIEQADIILLGLSRTSKTPCSFYLAQQGYKVINIPVIMGMEIQPEVFTIDQNKIVCLVMDPEVLQKIRLERLKHYKTSSNYGDVEKILEEVEMMYDLAKKNRQWHLIDTTNKSIEETAREILSRVYGREIEL